MRFDIITIFPNIFSGFMSESLLAKAQKKPAPKGRGLASGGKLITIKTHYLRDWTEDRHQTVDGKPYGGGPGLVFKIEPIFKAVKELKAKSSKLKAKKVILFSPRGKKFDQAMAK